MTRPPSFMNIILQISHLMMIYILGIHLYLVI